MSDPPSPTTDPNSHTLLSLTRSHTNPNHKRRKIMNKDIEQALDDLLRDESINTIEIAILHLMHAYDFDLSDLKRILTARKLDVSFSNVKFDDIAPLVGLNPMLRLRDTGLFEVHRARIRDDLFRQIRCEMIEAINNYGIPTDHENEEARSRYLAPLISGTVAQFKLLIQNTPESMLEGRITTKERIEYLFRSFGSINVLFIEVKYRLVGGNELLNTVAQVIAEADACDFYNNRSDLRTTVYGILCDSDSFQFFSFDHNANPKVGVGYFPFLNMGQHRDQKLRIPDFGSSDAKDWISSLRTVSEAIYYVLIVSYKGSLQAYYERSLSRPAKSGRTGTSTPTWVSSISLANDALGNAVKAAQLHATACRDGTSTTEGKELAIKAFNTLQESVDAAPPEFQRGDAQRYTTALANAPDDW